MIWALQTVIVFTRVTTFTWCQRRVLPWRIQAPFLEATAVMGCVGAKNRTHPVPVVLLFHLFNSGGRQGHINTLAKHPLMQILGNLHVCKIFIITHSESRTTYRCITCELLVNECICHVMLPTKCVQGCDKSVCTQTHFPSTPFPFFQPPRSYWS